MNPDTSDAERERIDTAAAMWIEERVDGLSPERAAAFARWREADPRHGAALARLERARGHLADLPLFRAELDRRYARDSSRRQDAASSAWPRWRHVATWGGMAALFLVGIAGVRWAQEAGTEIRYAAAAVGSERVQLDDGSVVELNVNSAVTVRLKQSERSIRLEAGEAHFSVAPDAARPFVVQAGDVAVRAVGTAFNVRYGSAGVEVIVFEGRVQVEPSGRAATRPLVEAGERVVVPKDAVPTKVDKLSPSALSGAQAWQRPLVEFADVPLREIIGHFNRRNRVQLVLADPALGAQLMGGTFALGEVDAFVRLLVADGEIVADRQGDKIILRRP